MSYVPCVHILHLFSRICPEFIQATFYLIVFKPFFILSPSDANPTIQHFFFRPYLDLSGTHKTGEVPHFLPPVVRGGVGEIPAPMSSTSRSHPIPLGKTSPGRLSRAQVPGAPGRDEEPAAPSDQTPECALSSGERPVDVETPDETSCVGERRGGGFGSGWVEGQSRWCAGVDRRPTAGVRMVNRSLTQRM